MLLIVCVPQIPVEALTPNMVVLGGEAFERWLGLAEAMKVGPPQWD